tara:strand:+ start:2314 stop:2943 length:630 start_codon:yes stop_codon:yes gene_type:complete
MLQEWSYFYFKKALSAVDCQKIIDFAIAKKKEQFATTGSLNDTEKLTKKRKKQILKIRDSNVVWMSESWIYDLIDPFISKANYNAGWKFEFNYHEPSQFTIYRKGQYYDWHQDSYSKPYENKENIHMNGKTRKLSMTLQLSKPSSYKGGKLEFYVPQIKKPVYKKFICNEIAEQGSICVFPSHVWHRVTPVTKGTRYSLVNWTLGAPFK